RLGALEVAVEDRHQRAPDRGRDVARGGVRLAPAPPPPPRHGDYTLRSIRSSPASAGGPAAAPRDAPSGRAASGRLRSSWISASSAAAARRERRAVSRRRAAW